jgi:hypothetical protein
VPRAIFIVVSWASSYLACTPSHLKGSLVTQVIWPSKWFNKIIINKYTIRVITTLKILHSIYWWELQSKRLDHKGLVYKFNHSTIKESQYKIVLLAPKLISYSLNDYKFQQVEMLVKPHSFTFIIIYFMYFNTDYA